MTRRGDRLRACAARLFDARTMARVVDPAIADLQAERPSLVAYVAVLKVIVLCGLGGSMPMFQSWSDDDRATLRRAAGVCVVALPLLTAFIAWPLFRFGALSGRAGPVGVALTLLPFALGLSVPMALTFGIAFGLGGRMVSRRLVQAVILVALVSSFASVVNAGWIAPAANQMFRVARASEVGIAPESLRPNASEMSSPELRQHIRQVTATGQASAAEIRTLEMTYASRWAMAFSPIALAMFMLSVVAWPSMRRWFAGISALVAVLGYYGAGNFGRSVMLAGDTSAFLVGAWLPNAVFVALAGALLALSARRQGARPSPAAS